MIALHRVELARTLTTWLCCLVFCLPVLTARAATSQATTMVGWVTQREAVLWVQTTTDAVVKARYWHGVGLEAAAHETVAVLTTHEHHSIATLMLTDLAPGQHYSGQLLLNGTPLKDSDFHFETNARTLPEDSPADFRLALISGLRDLDSLSDGAMLPPPDYSFIKALSAQKPTATLWLGNNSQLRASDWTSDAGYWRRASTSRRNDAVSSLLTSGANYGVLGPLDYGPPDSGSSWIHRATALETFSAFWPAPATSTKGAWTQISLGEMDLFCLDVASLRGRGRAPEFKTGILGQEQLDWLMAALRTSQAPVKLIAAGIPLLNPIDSPDYFASAKAERIALLEYLETQKINGVVILSGTTGPGEATRMPRTRGYPYYELSVGSVSDSMRSQTAALNYFRVPGTTVKVPHFATVTLSGPHENRTLRFEVFTAKGDSLWADTLSVNSLQWP